MIGHNHLGKNGRFGNQMFQYVFGKHLSNRFNVEVKYEISYFKKPKFINYAE